MPVLVCLHASISVSVSVSLCLGACVCKLVRLCLGACVYMLVRLCLHAFMCVSVSGCLCPHGCVSVSAWLCGVCVCMPACPSLHACASVSVSARMSVSNICAYVFPSIMCRVQCDHKIHLSFHFNPPPTSHSTQHCITAHHANWITFSQVLGNASSNTLCVYPTSMCDRDRSK